MNFPLANRLKKRLHIEIASLQDEVIDLIYSISTPVLRGGTAIWRCYDGNRFSEVLNFYMVNDKNFRENLRAKLEEHNLKLVKYKETENVCFAKISNGIVEVKLEINLSVRPKEKIAKPFEKVNGATTIVLTLSPDALFIEKIQTYRNRRLVRDIYDIFHLSKFIERKESLDELKKFLGEINQPVDEKNLKTIAYSGAVPSFEQMITHLRFLK